MGFWDINNITAANLNRLGPWADEIVGTDGNYASLNAAVAAGARRIVLADGAYLSTGLTLASASGGFIVNLSPQLLTLGAYGIAVTAGSWRFQGFRLYNGSGVGIYVFSSAGYCEFVNIEVRQFTSHGLQIEVTNDHFISGSKFLLNGGSGIRIGSSPVAVRAIGNMSYGNTGYGFYDGGNKAMLIGNRLDGNTAGAIYGTPAVDVGNKKT